MSGVTEPAGDPYTVDDLDAMPDDGRPAPVPAAEVASPSTSPSDRNLERAHDERLGVPSYWMPRPTGPGARLLDGLRPGGRPLRRARRRRPAGSPRSRRTRGR